MPSQRPFFLSSFFAAFRQRGPTLQTNSPSNKHQSTVVGSSSASSAGYAQTSAGAARAISTTAAGTSSSTQQAGTRSSPRSSLSIHSPRGAAGASASGTSVPGAATSGRRRGSDSSSEGFRDARGAEKWYIGGRTAGGEERFFQLGVMKRVRSNDGLSLDRLSL
ncbi:hypothetical protein E4U52_001658 [Claviceps spartinae]|nr:hypothetical protein E4U52_001658 [Claviceps spartinae]